MEGDFIFNPGRTPTIAREEVKEYGVLAIRGKQAGIELWLGDRRLGTTELRTALVISDLETGTYRLKARKEGYKDWERDVEVATDKRTDVVIDAEPVELPKLAKADDRAGVPSVIDTARIVEKFRVPLPDDAHISPPAESVSAAARAFLGVWFGVWDGNKLDHILVVEEIDGDKAQVIYAWSDSSAWGSRRNFTRATGQLQDKGQTLVVELLRPATVIYRMNRRGELDAFYRYAQGSALATMTKQAEFRHGTR